MVVEGVIGVVVGIRMGCLRSNRCLLDLLKKIVNIRMFLDQKRGIEDK